MKREFKVGDRVKIIGNCNFHYYKIGEEVILIKKRMQSNEKKGEYYFPTKKLDGTIIRGNNIREKDMKLISPNESKKSIHITTDGTDTHAVLKDGKEIIKHVKVGLYREDEYKFEIGVMEVVKKD